VKCLDAWIYFILFYGAENWVLTPHDITLLDSFHRFALSRCLGYTNYSSVSLLEMRRLCAPRRATITILPPLYNHVATIRIRYLLRICKLGPTYPTFKAIAGNLPYDRRQPRRQFKAGGHSGINHIQPPFWIDQIISNLVRIQEFREQQHTQDKFEPGPLKHKIRPRFTFKETLTPNNRDNEPELKVIDFLELDHLYQVAASKSATRKVLAASMACVYHESNSSGLHMSLYRPAPPPKAFPEQSLAHLLYVNRVRSGVFPVEDAQRVVDDLSAPENFGRRRHTFFSYFAPFRNGRALSITREDIINLTTRGSFINAAPLAMILNFYDELLLHSSMNRWIVIDSLLLPGLPPTAQSLLQLRHHPLNSYIEPCVSLHVHYDGFLVKANMLNIHYCNFEVWFTDQGVPRIVAWDSLFKCTLGLYTTGDDDSLPMEERLVRRYRRVLHPFLVLLASLLLGNGVGLWDPSTIPIYVDLDQPQQREGSNDCAIFATERMTARLVGR